MDLISKLVHLGLRVLKSPASKPSPLLSLSSSLLVLGASLQQILLFRSRHNGELPSEQQSLQMEQWGLAPVPHCDQVLRALHAVVSRYCGNTTPSDTPFDPTLNRHLVCAANAIARELGTSARDQYGAASQGLRLINMLDLMEVVHYPHSAFENCLEPFIASQSHPSCQSVVEMGIIYLVCWIEVASVHLKQTANIAV
ncbi:hypothetical protein BKA82DRAFT_4348019 [Pisolithus tinctorius]|nr:hypothetical protein BKA82DRAFT_4348019 [Pisolithus tinctorius]